jgi:hypothetical protein
MCLLELHWQHQTATAIPYVFALHGSISIFNDRYVGTLSHQSVNSV